MRERESTFDGILPLGKARERRGERDKKERYINRHRKRNRKYRELERENSI